MPCNHIPSVRCPECADNRPSMGYWPTPCGTCASLREENAALQARLAKVVEALSLTQNVMVGSYAAGWTVHLTGEQMKSIRASLAAAKEE